MSGDPYIGRALAAGKLSIESCVGQGGAGTVYRAHHRDLQMPVAVKVMLDALQTDVDFCRRFHAEALAASRLDQANLTRVYDFGQEPDGLLYIAMEYLDGRSVRELLEAERKVDFARAAQLGIQICSGLTHAHARNVVHRDIKPENLVLVRGLDEDGRETEIVKICDFGIAHRAAIDPNDFAGTAEYIAPELFEGETPSVQSDVYACGVVLYELLTGVVPIEGTIPEIIPRVRREMPPPPSKLVPGIDGRIDRLVMKAIAKDREVRHASARELRRDLQETAEAIALFSSGGYWEGVTGNVGGQAPSARPSVADDDGGDWLEREPAVLASIMPSSAREPAISSARPPSARPSTPSRASMPSYGNIGTFPPPSSRTEAAQSLANGIMTGSHISMVPTSNAEADDVAAKVDRFVRQIVTIRDSEKFGEAVGTLGPKIKMLVEQGHFVPAWRICAMLEEIASEPHGFASRAEHAHRALAVFKERDGVKHAAEKALDLLEDRDGAARKLVAHGGNHGAHALYSARIKQTSFESRERFVTTLQEIGAAALPTISAGLAKLETRLSVPGALWLAEDLLKAVPPTNDDELAQLLVRYARTEVPSLAMLGADALARVAGIRARGVLVAQIHHKDNDTAIAAIKRLRKLGGIDRDVISHLRTILVATSGGRPSVRQAAIESLGDTTKEAAREAQALLLEIIDAAQGTTPDVEEIVVAAASSLVAIGGDVTIVAARWKTSVGFMRTRLEAILRRARADYATR